MESGPSLAIYQRKPRLPTRRGPPQQTRTPLQKTRDRQPIRFALTALSPCWTNCSDLVKWRTDRTEGPANAPKPLPRPTDDARQHCGRRACARCGSSASYVTTRRCSTWTDAVPAFRPRMVCTRWGMTHRSPPVRYFGPAASGHPPPAAMSKFSNSPRIFSGDLARRLTRLRGAGQGS
jgi:hypothetical protein